MGPRWDPAGAVAQIEAAYRHPGPVGATDPSALPQRAEYFGAALGFALANPRAMNRLHRATARLTGVSTLSALLPRILEAALELTGADFGDVQLRDPATGTLWLTTEFGFEAEFLEYFAVVHDTGSVCGRAAVSGQLVVPDVAADPAFAPHRDIAAAAGFRGVQCTPLLDYAGRVVGMVSTHFRDARRPTDEELRILRLYADCAGAAIARCLGEGCGTAFDPIGQAMVAALLAGSGDVGEAAEPPSGAPRPLLPPIDPARDLSDGAALFAATSDRLVRHLFDVGLRLHRLEAIFDRADASPQDMRAARAAVTGVVEDLDMLTRDAGLAMLALASEQAAGPKPVRRNAIRRKHRW
ncbi:GAF domain-containing protein [Nocardia sp. NPDC048505]|uniref:GAF domain-containing protein n=1 Tax=unclassified Nocardia TaxID=2637762 RepID=UPI0033F18860